MSDESMTAKERAILFALMAEAGEVSNPELRARVGFVLDGAARRRLNDLKLVQSQLRGRPYVHELTDNGWAWCRTALTASLPEPSDNNGRALHSVLTGLHRFLERSNLQLSDVFQPLPGSSVPADSSAIETVDVDARIRAAYRQLAPDPGAWVRLAHLRRHLEDVAAADMDAALRRLNRAPDVIIVPDSDQRALTPEDRVAALRIGGEDKHLLMVESA